MNKPFTVLTLVIIAISGTAIPAQAAMVELTGVFDAGAGSLAGESFSFQFDYDASIAPTIISPSSRSFTDVGNSAILTVANESASWSTSISATNEATFRDVRYSIFNDTPNIWGLDFVVLIVLPFIPDLETRLQNLPTVEEIDNNSTLFSFSGNSESVSSTFDVNVSTVPIPAAVWLFGFGLIGLIGLARRKA